MAGAHLNRDSALRKVRRRRAIWFPRPFGIDYARGGDALHACLDNSMSGGKNETGGLARRAALGAAWVAAARFVMRLFGFVNTIILARLLVPEDFGLVAVAVTVMQLLQGLSDIGVSQAVVKFHDADRADLDTLFTLNALRGGFIALVLLAIGPWAAGFYDDPRMLWVFTGVAAYPLMIGLINPRFFEFERNLDFSREFVSSAAQKFVGVAVSVAVAVLFHSYWAIILGLVAGGAVQLVLSYAMRPNVPRATLASLRKVLSFSGWLTGVSFMAALNNKLDAFILARVAGKADTGHYYIGLQLSELPTNELAGPITRAIYPGLAALQKDSLRLRSAFLRSVEALAAIAMPAALGFAFIADDLILLLLGDKWAPTVPVVQILTPVLGLQTLFLTTQFYAMALGRTRLVFLREVMFFLIRFPTFLWASISFGLEGAIYATAGCGLVHVALNMALYSRVAGRPLWEPLWVARRSFVGALVMAVYFLFARPLIGSLDQAPALLQVVADVIAGATLFLAAHFVAWRAEGAPPGAETLALSAAKSAARRLGGGGARA